MMLIRIIFDIIQKKNPFEIPEGIKIFRILYLFPQLKQCASSINQFSGRNPQLQLWDNKQNSELFNHFNGFSNK